jgi:hypothetical protein
VSPPLTFDDCLVLDIDRLIRERYVVPGMRKDGRVMFPGGFWVPYAFDGAKTLTLTMPDGPQRIRVITYAQVHGRRHVCPRTMYVNFIIYRAIPPSALGTRWG